MQPHEAYDCLETTEDLYDPIRGETRWHEAFAREVIAHLAAAGERPLEMSDGLKFRLAHEDWAD